MSQRTCTIEGCDRKHYGSGLCNAHYQRRKRGAPMEGEIREPTWRPRGTAEKLCTQPGCDRRHFAKGYCSVHHWRLRHGSDMDAPVRVYAPAGQRPPCSEPECDKTSAARGLCMKHYNRWYIENGPRCRLGGCESVVQAQELCRMHFHIARKYNITPESWEEMYAAQGGRCRICQSAITRTQAQTDHDHGCCPGTANSCGECVRGLLCRPCNQGLGYFRDNPARLRAAAQYVTAGRSEDLFTADQGLEAVS